MTSSTTIEEIQFRRGRWRLQYKPKSGFSYGTQPPRQSRGAVPPPWPSPDDAWLELMRWEQKYPIGINQTFPCQGFVDQIQQHVDDSAPRDVFRALLADCIDRLVPPDAAISHKFEAFVANHPLQDGDELRRAVQGSARAGKPSAGRDRLSALPLEIFDMILDHSLEIGVEICATHSIPAGSSGSGTAVFTAAERAALAPISCYRHFWVLITAMPAFHVSTLWRERTVASMQRRLAAVDGPDGRRLRVVGGPLTDQFRSRATVRLEHDCSRRSSCDDALLSWGLAYPGSEALKTLPRRLEPVVEELHVEVVWNCERGGLMDPVKRLIGLESIFPHLNRIVVSCRVVGLEAQGPEADSWKNLATALYGRGGVYSKIVAEVGLAFTIAVWGLMALRTGIWPGYCLRPECGNHGSAPCLRRLPFLCFRAPVVDVRLMPVLDDWPSSE